MNEFAMVVEELKNIENDLETLFIRFKNINKQFNKVTKIDLQDLKIVVYISRAEVSRLLEIPETTIERLEQVHLLSVPKQRAGKDDKYILEEVISLRMQKKGGSNNKRRR